jgi:hypothetical protein
MKRTVFEMIKSTALVTLLCLLSCADDGDQGPAGPQGTAGPQGAVGPKGETGTANIIYSDWFALNIKTGKIMHYVNSTTTGVMYEFSAPSITQDVLDRGMVVVFFKYGDAVHSLPIVNYQGFGIDMELFYVKKSKLYILFHKAGLQANQSTVFIEEEPKLFRYVVIPGGNPEAGTGRMATPVDYRDYEALKAYHNIRD